MRGDVEDPEIAVVVEGVLVQGAEFAAEEEELAAVCGGGDDGVS